MLACLTCRPTCISQVLLATAWPAVVSNALPNRLAEALLEECVAHFVAAVVSFLRSVTEDEVAAIRRDYDRLRQFFARYTKADKVGRKLRWD